MPIVSILQAAKKKGKFKILTLRSITNYFFPSDKLLVRAKIQETPRKKRNLRQGQRAAPMGDRIPPKLTAQESDKEPRRTRKHGDAQLIPEVFP